MARLAWLFLLLITSAHSFAQDSVAVTQPGDASAGEKVYFLCVGCHGDTAEHRPTGPHLYDIYGRQAGILEGFNYSSALTETGLFWDERTLDEFIANPMQRVPGTMMAVGVANAKDRADLIEYLKTLTQK